MSTTVNPVQNSGQPHDDDSRGPDFAERVRLNQQKLSSDLKPQYDFIVCGSGFSGSVLARRLAENPDVSVLLIEAGGSADAPSVTEANQWPLNLGTERSWGFLGQPSPYLNGRSIPLAMGKLLCGGSMINAMVWAHGHKNDWDFFASEAGDAAWNYESVLSIFRRIEDWHGAPDPKYRDGKRQSVFRSYTFPYMDRPNLTVLTQALVTRVTFMSKRATGVEIAYDNKTLRINAGLEVVLSLGAIQTPKVLMLSGIGDHVELQRLGIPLMQHLRASVRTFKNNLEVPVSGNISNRSLRARDAEGGA